METTKLKLSEEKRNEIIKEIEGVSQPIYFDTRYGMEESVKIEILEKGIDEFLMELEELNIDYIFETKKELKKEILEHYAEQLECSVEELEEEFEDYNCSVYIDPKDPLKGEKVNVRIELYSNYDCINSNHCEGNAYSFKESYFGDMVNALNLNPAKLKKVMKEQGIEAYGPYPNYKWRNGKELVDYDEFCEELLNSCSGANLLTIPAKLDLYEMYELGVDSLGDIEEVLIPSGTNFGLFSSFQGGGSILEMSFTMDTNINLKKQWGWGVTADDGYSIKSVYGVGSDFYTEIEINKVVKK